MGFLFKGGIPLTAPMALAAPVPLNVFAIVEFRADLNLPDHPTAPGVFEAHLRHPFVTVAVMEDRTEYWLRNGLTDADWEVKGAMSSTILPVWTNDTDYVEGQIVWFGGQLWRAKTTHKSNASDGFVDDEANWESTSADTFSIDATLVTHGNIPAGIKLEDLTFAQYMDMQVNPDIPADITGFTATPAFGLRERGVDITSIALNAAWTPTKNAVDEVQITQDGTALTDGTFTGNDKTATGNPVNGLTNVAFGLSVKDTEGLEATRTGTYTFINPTFLGTVPGATAIGDVTEAMVKAGERRLVPYRTNLSRAFTISMEKAYIWIPEGVITVIMDQNGFPNTDSWESVALTMENAANEQVAGRLYMMRTPATQSNFRFDFTWS